MEWRVAIEELRNSAEAMIRHLIFIAHHLTLDKAQTCALIELQRCFHIESTKPRPSSSLMISIVALCLWTYIHRIVATTLWRERTQALRSQQLTSTDVNDTLLLSLIQRRIIKGCSKYHIRTNTPIAWILIVYIVEQISMLIEEYLNEWSLHLLSQLIKMVYLCIVARKFWQRSSEAQSIIPQSVELNDITSTRNNRTTISSRVHPSNGFLLALRI